MDILSSPNIQDQTKFALDAAKLYELNRPLKNRENKEELQKAAKQFEGVFVSQLLEQMDKTVDRSSEFFGDGQAEETFRGMLNEKIADSIANKNGGSGLGLAEIIYR